MNKLSNQEYYRAFLMWWTQNFRHQDYDKMIDHFNHPDVLSGSQLPNGWLRTARESLMISVDQCAEKLGMSRANYSQFEKRELEGKITIETLARAAEALDCELVYAIRPKKRVRFSQLIWQKLLSEAQVHSWVRRSSPQTKPQALAKIATDLFHDPEFRKRQGWKRRSY
jgi:transcriptional regulator with XRE-family HTH domain